MPASSQTRAGVGGLGCLLWGTPGLLAFLHHERTAPLMAPASLRPLIKEPNVPMRTLFRRFSFPVTLVVLMLFAAAPSYGSLTAPVVTAPTNGGTFDTLPVFAWTPVAGADHYQFQLAADSSFSSN